MGTEKCSNKRNRSKKREEAVTDDEAKYLEWRSNEAYRAVSRRSLEVTFSLLSKKQKLTSTEQKRRQSCRGISPHSVSLDTASVIFKGIRTSILTKNWNALNELLLQLLSKHKIYRNYVRKVSSVDVFLLIYLMNVQFSVVQVKFPTKFCRSS